MFQVASTQTLNRLLAHPVVPVFYHAEAARARQVLDACYAGGVRVFEFSNRGPAALAVFTDLRAYARAHYPDLTLGVGTIYTDQEADAFLEAGAEFVVQPIISATVAAVCRHYDRLWMPGVMTLNEIYQATRLGAAIVKVFPADVVGPAYVKAVRGPLPKVKVMVTGGVEPTKASLQAWFAAGVNAVGLGSLLFQPLLTPTDLTNQLAELLTFAAEQAPPAAQLVA